jgi:hypothetical protein
MTPKEKQIYETLISAIKGNNLVEFLYDDKQKIVEPYLIGELYSIHQNHLQKGIFALRAWFVSGHSSQPVDRHRGDRWRIYHLNKITGLVIREETNMNVRPLYDLYDKDFKRINFRVEIKPK